MWVVLTKSGFSRICCIGLSFKTQKNPSRGFKLRDGFFQKNNVLSNAQPPILEHAEFAFNF